MKLKFKVTGMTCAACSARVEKVTAAVPGVNKVEVNLLAGTMQVGNVILALAGLSYIGLGIQQPLPEWGAMLSGGRIFNVAPR